MDTQVLTITTGDQPAVVDLTADAARFVAGRGDGLLSVFVPHGTAGVAVMGVETSIEQDLLDQIAVLFPRDGRWRHRHGTPGHGADHVFPAFVSPATTVPVFGGTLALGTWQSIVLIDPNADNPTRQVRLSFITG
jgi:secondary thiamine-phosphate synthase enzyme